MTKFTVVGEPVAKERARVVNGRAFTPKRTKAYEEQVAWAYRQQKGSFYETQPVKVKIELYQKRLQEKNANLSIVEPIEPKEKKGMWYKVRLVKYKRALKRYIKNKERRAYYEKQLKNCEIHSQVIELYMQRKIQEGKALLESIEDDGFQLFLPRYRAVTYNKIFNMSIETSKLEEEQFSYREQSILLQKIVKSVAVGCLSIAIMTSLALDFKVMSFQSIVYMFMNLITLLWFAYNGIKSADILVFGSIMQADANRIKVSNLYRDNCLKNGDTWANNLKDTKEVENETVGRK